MQLVKMAALINTFIGYEEYLDMLVATGADVNKNEKESSYWGYN